MKHIPSLGQTFLLGRLYEKFAANPSAAAINFFINDIDYDTLDNTLDKFCMTLKKLDVPGLREYHIKTVNGGFKVFLVLDFERVVEEWRSNITIDYDAITTTI